MEVYKFSNYLKDKDIEKFYEKFLNKEVLFKFVNNILCFFKKEYRILLGDVSVQNLPKKFHEKMEKCNIVLTNYKKEYMSLTIAGKYRFDITNIKLENVV